MAIACFIFVLLSPQLPSDKVEKNTGVAQQINLALAKVNSASPMEGILELRTIAEENPENAEVQWQLANFSVQTEQFDKAALRFEKVIELDAESYPDAWFFLGRTYATLGEFNKALNCFETYRGNSSDTAIVAGMDKMIIEIKNELKNIDHAERKEEEKTQNGDS